MLILVNDETIETNNNPCHTASQNKQQQKAEGNIHHTIYMWNSERQTLFEGKGYCQYIDIEKWRSVVLELYWSF